MSSEGNIDKAVSAVFLILRWLWASIVVWILNVIVTNNQYIAYGYYVTVTGFRTNYEMKMREND